MSDYISREANGGDFVRRADIVEKFMDRLPSISVGYLCKIADEIPAADVRPVKRGTWMIGFGYPYPPGTYCPNCGFAWSEQIAAVTLEPSLSRIKTNFCPNCGADMTGGADG